MYETVFGIIGIIATLIATFFYGKLTGSKTAKTEEKVKQQEVKIEVLEKVEAEHARTTEAVREVREHVNSSPDGSAADELRRDYNRDRKDRM